MEDGIAQDDLSSSDSAKSDEGYCSNSPPPLGEVEEQEPKPQEYPQGSYYPNEGIYLEQSNEPINYWWATIWGNRGVARAYFYYYWILGSFRFLLIKNNTKSPYAYV